MQCCGNYRGKLANSRSCNRVPRAPIYFWGIFHFIINILCVLEKVLFIAEFFFGTTGYHTISKQFLFSACLISFLINLSKYRFYLANFLTYSIIIL